MQFHVLTTLVAVETETPGSESPSQIQFCKSSIAAGLCAAVALVDALPVIISWFRCRQYTTLRRVLRYLCLVVVED